MGIIVKPLVTEKMTSISEKSSRYGFIVSPKVEGRAMSLFLTAKK